MHFTTVTLGYFSRDFFPEESLVENFEFFDTEKFQKKSEKNFEFLFELLSNLFCLEFMVFKIID